MSTVEELLAEMEESQEVTETTSPRKYAYKDVINGKKCYLFSKKADEVHSFILKNDGSNVAEFLKLTQDYYVYSNTHKLTEGTLIRYEKEVDANANKHKAYVLDSGFYEVRHSDDTGYYLMEIEPSTGDKYVDLGGVIGDIEENIDTFYTKKNVYVENNLKHKMGVLLYGAPGNGKSSLIRELIKKYQSNKVVVFVDTSFPKSLIKNLKSFNQEFIFIFEEFTQNITRDSDLANILLFLDGENSLDNQLVIATTNYPESLPQNLASRPGRFDKLFEVKDPDDATRKIYLESQGITVDAALLSATKGFSIAYLREIVLATKLNDTKIEDEIKKNLDRKKLVEKAFAEPKGGIGLI